MTLFKRTPALLFCLLTALGICATFGAQARAAKPGGPKRGKVVKLEGQRRAAAKEPASRAPVRNSIGRENLAAMGRKPIGEAKSPGQGADVLVKLTAKSPAEKMRELDRRLIALTLAGVAISEAEFEGIEGRREELAAEIAKLEATRAAEENAILDIVSDVIRKGRDPKAARDTKLNTSPRETKSSSEGPLDSLIESYRGGKRGKDDSVVLTVSKKKPE